MNRLLIILLISFLGSSCESWLDVKPENQVTYTNFFEDEKDVEGAAFEMFATEAAYIGCEGDYLKWQGILADEWSDTYNAPRLGRFSDLAGGWGDGGWKHSYDIVFLANTILENAHRASMSKDRLNFWIGQASFTKGLAYFELARLYGDAVITKNSTSLEKYGRKPMLEVIDTAIVNAERAYRLLPVFEELKDLSGAAITSKQYASKGAAAALLAHLYAWRGSVIELYGLTGDATGDYQKSIDYCTLIIDKKAGFYELHSSPEALCQAMSKMGGEILESILELELNPKEDYAQAVRVLGVFLTGYPVNVNATLAAQKSRSFRLKWTTVEQMYEAKDKRVDAYFYLDDEILNNLQTYPYAYLRKWREGIYFTSSSGSSETTMGALRANQVQWRVADIYLLRAECRVKLGIADAKDDLNKVRTRANATLYPAVGESDLKLAIFKERERELLYENHRYADIVRNGKTYIQKYLGYSLETDKGLEENALKYVTDQDLKDGILFQPIPESAFLMNGLMRQTPFWLRYVKY